MYLYVEKTLREKVDKGGLGLDLAQQSVDLRWWHKDHRDTRAREANLDFVRNREYSPPDIMIFADSTSAREIMARRDFFRDREELNKWHSLPIMDEYPAYGGMQHRAGEERGARQQHLRDTAAHEGALLAAHVGRAHGAADE